MIVATCCQRSLRCGLFLRAAGMLAGNKISLWSAIFFNGCKNLVALESLALRLGSFLYRSYAVPI